jgi:virulence factor
MPSAARRQRGADRPMPLAVGVIGAGNMGSHHARTYAALGGVCELRGIHDRDSARAKVVAEQFDTDCYGSIEQLLEQVQAVSICTPSALHVEHALLALRAGVDVLIEKPVALDLAQAATLTEAVARARAGATAGGVARTGASAGAGAAPVAGAAPIVQVGHIEHFNPAVREVAKLLDGERLVALELQRLSPFDGRIQDADVIQDLMLHDVHVLLSLAGERELCDVHAAGRRVRSPMLDDYASATLTFDDGLIGTLLASRVTEEKIRRMSATTEDSHVTVDYLRRSVERCRSTRLELDGGGSRTYRQESLLERVFVPIEEPLIAQLRSFLQCVHERHAPEVDLAMGIRCLAVVEAIREACAAGGARKSRPPTRARGRRPARARVPA